MPNVRVRPVAHTPSVSPRMIVSLGAIPAIGVVACLLWYTGGLRVPHASSALYLVAAGASFVIAGYLSRSWSS